jgi:hypothetical protein
MDFELTKRYAGYAFLYPEFSDEILELVTMIRQEQLPFFLYETYRTPQRQKNLYARGYSKYSDPLKNPHVNGLAVDFLLNKSIITKLSNDSRDMSKIVNDSIKDMNSGNKRNEVYNIGTNLHPSRGLMERTIVQDKNVLNAWLKLGHMIDTKFPKLRWGGNKNKKPGQLIGSDPPQIEFYEMEKLIKNKVALKQIKASGAPGL